MARMTEQEFELFQRARRAAPDSREDEARRARTHANQKGGLFHPGGPKVLEPRKVADDGRSEHWHQAQVITWARHSAHFQRDTAKAEALRWLHSIPNGAWLGGKNPHAMANKLRKEGMTTGILDLRLDYIVRDKRGRIERPGLVIEMKKVGGGMTGEQTDYATFMRSQGYSVALCFTWVSAATEIVAYMSLDEYMDIR